MKLPFMVVIALFAVAEQQQCKNPFQNLATTPTPTGPRTAQEYCAQYSNVYGEYFHCNSNVSVAQAGLPNGWPGYCGVPNDNLGLTGYSFVTSSGARSFVMQFENAREQCRLLGSSCTSLIQCWRP